MDRNIRLNLKEEDGNQRVLVNLEEDFDNLEILSLKIGSTDVYSKTSSDFGTVVGRVQTSNGYGLENAKISIFVPIEADDKLKPEITELYPFETVNDQYPNGVRYNLLPRVRNQNPSHRAVGNFPTINDLTHYPQYLEILNKYYKYTATTNKSGDYMIFGVPLGSHNIMMDFDIFDTKSMEVTANDIVDSTSQYKNIKSLNEAVNGDDTTEAYQVPNFIYSGNDTFNVEVKTDINSMPNIFNEIKEVNISPFWGDEEEHDVGITRCDFKINYNYTPTAVFFGWLGSPSAGYKIKPDYTMDGDLSKLEVAGYNKALDKNTGEIWPLQEIVVVVYRLDDKLTPGSRVRVGAFRSEKGTGVFRLSLPMYMDYFKTNQFGDLVATNDTENSVPTKGYYSFEIYEQSEAWNDRVPWGGYNQSKIPGIRVPASTDGENLTGGWEGTNSGLFEYDIINRVRKFYTIKSRYTKHSETNMSVEGDSINFFPEENPDLDVPWNFPVNRSRVNEINDDIDIIGSALIPRYEMYIDVPNSKINDGDFNPTVNTPINVLNLIHIPSDISYGEPVKGYEYHKGIGVRLDGKNSGDIYAELFRPDQFMSWNTNQNWYGDNNTFNHGDNGPIIPTLFALELSKKDDSTARNGIHRSFNQAYSDRYSIGPFLSSTDHENKSPIIQFDIEDITSTLPRLIGDGVYTSYGFYTGSIPPEEFDPQISNRYRGKYYYFGMWDGINALKSIEKNYFTEHE